MASLVPLPGVGGNLQDHLELYFQFQCSSGSLQLHVAWWNRLLIGMRWLGLKDGLGATNHFDAGGFIRSQAGVQYPDVQVAVMDG